MKIVNLTTYELSLIAGKRGIKNYKNMSRKKSLSTLDESEGNFKNIAQNGLEQIAKMQNLSQNELNQITKGQNQWRDKLEQIAEMRKIKNYEKMSKEGLAIALLKSKRSLAELFNNNFSNDRIKGIRKTSMN